MYMYYYIYIVGISIFGSLLETLLSLMPRLHVWESGYESTRSYVVGWQAYSENITEMNSCKPSLN